MEFVVYYTKAFDKSIDRHTSVEIRRYSSRNATAHFTDCLKR